MKVGIIGSGTMGIGIVQLVASKNIDVLWYSKSQKELEIGKITIEKTLEKLLEKDKISLEEKKETLSRIKIIKELKEFKNSDFIIEAILEDIEIKKGLFKELEEVVNESTIIATNTSSLSITEIASEMEKRERVIGIHFFNPAPVMKLVEIISGLETSKEVLEKSLELGRKLEKEVVIVEEVPGFVVNRILIPMINEAISIYNEGVASVEGIDNAMKFGANHPIGPLALGDLIGLDVCLNIMETLHREYGEDKYRPHYLLKKMVKGKKLGRKTGEGFYKY